MRALQRSLGAPSKSRDMIRRVSMPREKMLYGRKKQIGEMRASLRLRLRDAAYLVLVGEYHCNIILAEEALRSNGSSLKEIRKGEVPRHR